MERTVMSMRKSFFLMCALFAAQVSTSAADARTLQQIRNSGELRVAITLASPWAMRDRDDNFLGYEVDNPHVPIDAA